MRDEKKMDNLPTELLAEIFQFLPYYDYRTWSLLSKRHDAVRIAHQKRLVSEVEKMTVGELRRIPRALLDKFVQTPRILFTKRFSQTCIWLCLRIPNQTDFHKAFRIYRNDIYLWFLQQFEQKTDYVEKLRMILPLRLFNEINRYITGEIEPPRNDIEQSFPEDNQNIKALFGFEIRLQDMFYLEHTIWCLTSEILADSLDRKCGGREKWKWGYNKKNIVFRREDLVKSFNFF